MSAPLGRRPADRPRRRARRRRRVSCATCPGEDWTRPTRAIPGSVRDQIAHLGFFEAAFTQGDRDALTTSSPSATRSPTSSASSTRANAEVPAVRTGGARVVARRRWTLFDWAAARALDARDPKARLPWYGPAMSLRSAITSRIMETWAHGADVAACARQTLPRRPPTACATSPTSASAPARRATGPAGSPSPRTPVLVELTAPLGGRLDLGRCQQCVITAIRRQERRISRTARPGRRRGVLPGPRAPPPRRRHGARGHR